MPKTEGSDTKSEGMESLNIILKCIKPYNGNRETLNAFLNNCQNAIDLAASSQQSLVLKYILSQLEGRAELACSIKTFEKWSSLRDFLKSQFGERKHYLHLLTDLQDCKQGPNENVTQFSLRVESCLASLLTDISMSCPRTTELAGRIAAMQDLALHTFILGLNPKIAVVVRCQDARTLNEAINMAISEEKIIQFSNKPSSNYQSNSSRNNQPHRIPQPGPSNPNKFYPNQRRYQPVVCRYCKAPGHSIEQCRKREYNNKRFQIPQNTRPVNFLENGADESHQDNTDLN